MATTTKSALEFILEWSQNRAEWQRDALRRIVAGGALGDFTSFTGTVCRELRPL